MSGENQRAVEGSREYYSLEVDFDVSSRTAPHEWVNQTEQMKGFRPNLGRPFAGVSAPPRIRFERKRPDRFAPNRADLRRHHVI